MRANAFRRLVKTEARIAKMDEGPSWIKEPHGVTRLWDLIFQAMDRFSYDLNPAWRRPRSWGGDLDTRLETYPDEAIEYGGKVAGAISKASTYVAASDLAFRMMIGLPLYPISLPSTENTDGSNQEAGKTGQ